MNPKIDLRTILELYKENEKPKDEFDELLTNMHKHKKEHKKQKYNPDYDKFIEIFYKDLEKNLIELQTMFKDL